MPPTIPAMIRIVVKISIPYMTTLGILDTAITITKDKIKARVPIRAIQGRAFSMSGN